MSIFRVQNIQEAADTIQHVEWNLSAQDHRDFVDDVSMFSHSWVLLVSNILFINLFDLGFQSFYKFNTEHFLEDFGDRGSVKQVLGISDCNGEVRVEEGFQELPEYGFVLIRFS
jgi:hypothetical protein